MKELLMDIKRIKLYNFLSYKNETVLFEKDGVYLIIGKDKETAKSNGSGKSAIVDAIAFALYNVSREGEKTTDSLIRLGTKKMIVQLEFIIDNNTYIIERTKTLKSNSIRIIKNNKDLDLKIRDAQVYINNLLGSDYKIFRNTAYFKQGDMDAFSKLSKNEAKELVMKILQLNIYDNYETLAKEKSRELSNIIKELQIKIDTDKELLSTEHKEEHIDIGKVEKEIIDLASKLEKLTAEYNRVEKEKEDLINQSNKQLNMASEVNGRLLAIGKRLSKLRTLKDKCPLCESTLKKEHIEKINKDLENSYDDLKKSYNNLISKSTEFTDEAQKLNILTYTTKTRQLENLITDKKMVLTELRTLDNKRKEEQARLDRIKDTIISNNLKLESRQNTLNNYEQLIRAFGKQGIQAYIIENVLPEIEAMVNSLLRNLNGNLRIILDGKKELKSGKVANTLDIRILDQIGERPYYNYSGGEKTLIDFALRISLAVILARRSNSQIQTLMLDECFNMLDSIGRVNMARAIKYVQRTYGFKKIILISHQEEALDEGFLTIKVIKDKNGSHIGEK
jgi:exonuclease SbcC